ncbi:HXXEE domain-containing protein [Streptomyces sp. CS113]|uniref:HXXEE domain-containing protein n=1 Tax=Streptomyces sp. CS113 TaxID=1982761 RepID=UPI000B41434E|nr:HXXEE domain-containing protein [Streptomyces sp. CS113]OWA10435.1 HXXEE domain-containing protein [Streptomyces sp. CS113]
MTNSSGEEQAVGGAVTLGLLAAWALHDLEELATVPGWWRRNLPALRERYPGVPEAVWRRAGSVDGREFAVAVGAMAAVVASASVAGRLTGGRSATYQAALHAFGLHGLVHLAQSGLVRGYTPGSATSPLIVVPFTLWARRRLRRAGVLRPTRPRDLAVALGFAGVATVAAHEVARRLTGRGA